MSSKIKVLRYFFLLTLALSILFGTCCAQPILSKNLSVDFQKVRLDLVLQTLSIKGNFYFSYNSSILRADSMVTLTARDKTLQQILDLLFRGSLEYREIGNYIILRRAPPQAMESKPSQEDRDLVIEGIVLDNETGQGIEEASIYDKKSLTATLSDKNGGFRLRVRNTLTAFTVSKELFEDTTVLLSQGRGRYFLIYVSPVSNGRREITISPDNIQVDTPVEIGPPRISGARKEPIRVELTPFGKFILSSKLRVQTINLSNFFIARPVQVSFVPGLSTNGPLNSQITNHFSLNILGGYSAGLRGFEAGGLFNIDRRKVEGFQAAGLINTVGGSVHGFQAAGIHNTVLDTFWGMQAAGISNYGVAIHGVQAAGIANLLTDSLHGVQVAGIINSAKTVTGGAQLAGIVNRVHHLGAGGVQIGLINIADSSEGVSIGLFNFVRRGYRELSVFADEVSPLNIAFRSGNLKLYTILIAGFNPDPAKRLYRVGFGLGHSFRLDKQLSLRPELTSEIISLPDSIYYVSSSNTLHVGLSPDLLLERLHLDLYWRPTKWIAFSAGPSISLFINGRPTIPNTKPYTIPHDMYPHHNFSDDLSGWIGWRASVHFF